MICYLNLFACRVYVIIAPTIPVAEGGDWISDKEVSDVSCHQGVDVLHVRFQKFFENSLVVRGVHVAKPLRAQKGVYCRVARGARSTFTWIRYLL